MNPFPYPSIRESLRQETTFSYSIHTYRHLITHICLVERTGETHSGDFKSINCQQMRINHADTLHIFLGSMKTNGVTVTVTFTATATQSKPFTYFWKFGSRSAVFNFEYNFSIMIIISQFKV